MAMETVAVLHRNRNMLYSDDPVKISRATVRKILRRTRYQCFSDTLLRWAFEDIVKRAGLPLPPPKFDLDRLKGRLPDLDAVDTPPSRV
jgi:farnesyl-diphosphate farnesyltransferase